MQTHVSKLTLPYFKSLSMTADNWSENNLQTVIQTSQQRFTTVLMSVEYVPDVKRSHTTGEAVLFCLSLPPSLSTSRFLAPLKGVKENQVIIFIDDHQRRTPCKLLSNAAAAHWTSIQCDQPVTLATLQLLPDMFIPDTADSLTCYCRILYNTCGGSRCPVSLTATMSLALKSKSLIPILNC